MTGRSVRCPTHGFYYDPERADGCVKCLEQTAEAEPASSGGGGFSAVSAFIWLVVLSALGWGGYRFFASMGERGGEIFAEQAETASIINPNLVRAPIESLEALVYADEITPFAHGTRIQRAAMVLYNAVMQATTPLLGSRHGGRIVAFGNVASQYESAGYTTIDLQRVQRDWEQLRTEVFGDADWFRRSR